MTTTQQPSPLHTEMLHVGQLSPEALRRISRSSGEIPRSVHVNPEQIPAGCPPGLEYLIPLDSLVLKHGFSPVEDAPEQFRKGSFYILSNRGEQLYFVNEENVCACGCKCSSWCTRHVLPLDVRITDTTGRAILLLERPLSWSSSWLPCFPVPLNCLLLQQMSLISTITGKRLGSLLQNYTLISSSFTAYDAQDTSLFRLTGYPQLSAFGCLPWESPTLDIFQKQESGEQFIGNISTSATRLEDTLSTSKEHLVVEFPLETPVVTKALIMAGLILIDHAYRSIPVIQTDRRGSINSTINSSE